MDETAVALHSEGNYSMSSKEVPANKIGSKGLDGRKKNKKNRFTFTSFMSMAGEVRAPTFIVKNFSRSLPKPKEWLKIMFNEFCCLLRP